MAPLQRSVGRFHAWEPLRVEGDLPGLVGDLLRAGPGLRERFGRPLAHSFEADGAIFGLRLAGDGRALGAVRLVESPGYRAEEAAGRPLYGSAAPRWRRILNTLRGRDKATGNTTAWAWQGQVYALMEAARPVAIAGDDLRTLGPSDLGGVVGKTFSAHPHRLDAAGITYNFGQVLGPKPALELYALPDHGAARRLGQVPLRFNTMVHDFAITPGYAVFVISSIGLRIGRALLAPADPLSLVAWEPERGAELLIVALDRPETPQRIPLSPRFVFHLANAFVRGDQLVVDVVQYPDLGVLSALATEKAKKERGEETEAPAIAPPQLHRLVVTLATGALREDAALWSEPCEFPTLAPAEVGGRHSALWLVTGDGDSSGLVRLDGDGAVADLWRPGLGFATSEAVFVATPEAGRATAGWLISLVFDATAGASFWAIFDAEDLAAGPRAKLWHDQPLPATFHGTWIPGTRG